MSGNRLTAVPAALAHLTKLVTLDLGRNRLSSLPSYWAQWPHLKYLYLDDNPYLVLPPSLLALKGRRSLVLKVDYCHAYWKAVLT